MANVTEIKPHPKNAEWRVVTVGDRDFVVFAGKLADGLAKGQPLPQGTTEEPPKFEGALPALRLPRPQGGGGGYRQSKEAFEAEAASRLAWQQVEEERKDRRTALMQAVTLAPGEDTEFGTNFGRTFLLADRFYQWLRSSPAVSEPAAERDVASTASGSGQAGGISSAPDNTGQKTGLGEAGADASASSGEVGADMKPGEVTSSPSPGFPISPSDCDHKGASGHWLPTKVIDGQARCPRCGESAVIYRESS